MWCAVKHLLLIAPAAKSFNLAQSSFLCEKQSCLTSFVTHSNPAEKLLLKFKKIDHSDEFLSESNNNLSVKSSTLNWKRRSFVEYIASLTSVVSISTIYSSKAVAAGDVETKINTAVTKSDLGISVRKSVVKGAQFIDKLDLQWEKFSDSNNLGTERSKRDRLPSPKIIPENLLLDSKFARVILDSCDAVFLSLMVNTANEDQLKMKIEKIDESVRKSFVRSGLTFEGQPKSSSIIDAQSFNYICFVHFRAYNDLLVENSVKFNPFRKEFERQLGDKILGEVGNIREKTPSEGAVVSAENLKGNLLSTLNSIGVVVEEFRKRGLLAQAERSDIDNEKITDWSTDLSDLQFSLAVDGDVTLNAQILLQELGYRLYPDFSRLTVASLLRQNLEKLKQTITSEDYYMDTAYNSDPEKFKPKQVLINFAAESQ